MLDIPSFITALKLTWIKPFSEGQISQWIKLIQSEVFNTKKCLEMGAIWHKNLIEKVQNPFWREVFTCWISFHEKFQPFSKAEAVCNPLRNNPNIFTISLYNNNLYKNGCVYIADICDTSYKLYDLPSIRNIYNSPVNFLEYLRIANGLNNYFKKLGESSSFPKPIEPLITSLVLKKNGGSMVFYNILIRQDQLELPSFKLRWSPDLGKNLLENGKRCSWFAIKVFRTMNSYGFNRESSIKFLELIVFYTKWKNPTQISVVYVKKLKFTKSFGIVEKRYVSTLGKITEIKNIHNIQVNPPVYFITKP